LGLVGRLVGLVRMQRRLVLQRWLLGFVGWLLRFVGFVRMQRRLVLQRRLVGFQRWQLRRKLRRI